MTSNFTFIYDGECPFCNHFAELLELKANPNKKASGTVVESELDKGRGYLTTIMVQGGTLKKGDII